MEKEIKKVSTTKETKKIEILILNKVKLKKDLSKYSEDKLNDMRVYEKGEKVENVNSKYQKRFEKFPNNIKIIK